MIRRAIILTFSQLGIHNWRYLLRTFFLFGIALVLVYFIGGQSQMTEEWRWGISAGIALICAFAALFIWNVFAELKTWKYIRGLVKAVKIEKYTHTITPQLRKGKYPIEIRLIIKIRKPPVQLAQLKLCIGNHNYEFDSVVPSLSINPLRLVDKVEHITAQFEVDWGHWRQALSKNISNVYECRYHISASVGGKPYVSKEYVFENPPRTGI